MTLLGLDSLLASNTDYAVEAAADVAPFALELDGVGRRFGALSAVTDVNMRIQPGERRAILGSNGAGKTTLLNLISGDLVATDGTIDFFGFTTRHLPTQERIRLGMRRTYQISELFDRLSVEDTVYLAVLGVDGKRFSLRRPKRDDAAMQRARALVDFVQLDAVRHYCAGQLSHGERRQLEVAMALVGTPRLILFDEPAAGLSPVERADLAAILESLPRTVGFLIIEHDLDVALRVSDRVTMMHNGRVFAEGTPQEIQNDSRVQELYLGGRHA
ncbi:ABC transporter ATP-binding protein [Mesorhizobium sp. M1169]|uniref:ABC transporter ATP-binding protein n=1 Tax=Mesorhizobium sp. M1169 TaxID=2957066 RepID=UPI00333CDE93